MSEHSDAGHAHSGHGHGHAHGLAPGADRRLIAAAGALIVAFMAGEVVAGLVAHSLALLSDAAHMLTDAASIGLVLITMKVAGRPASGGYTYGLRRLEILSAQANGITLVLLALWLAYEAVRRLIDPRPVAGGLMLAVAVTGVVVNLAAAWLLHRASRRPGQRRSLNSEGAFAHVLTDLYAFAATVIAAVVVLATGFHRADAIATLIVAALMVRAGAGLIAQSGRIFLEAAPAGVDPAAVGAALVGRPHVIEVHDLHIWEITSGMPAASAHILVARHQDCHAIRAGLVELLDTRFGITHATLQVDHVPPEHVLRRAAEHPEDGDLRHCEDTHGPSYRAPDPRVLVRLSLPVVEKRAEWDVAVIGGGPAGLAAARAAAAAGARTVVLERSEHPRYKTCGGGLMGASLTSVADLEDLPSRDSITSVTFTLHGKRQYTRRHDTPILGMVVRDEFDDALRRRAEAAGAVIRQRTAVRGIDQGDDHATVRLSGGAALTATSVIGADGSAGITARHVGADFAQTDLGLEQEIDVPDAVADAWRGRVLLDWGSYPGSYAWVFPKGGRLTVGVIASRGEGEWTKRYLRTFAAQVKLDSYPVARDSGHLTRCRADDSPLRRGRVLVAGDAAGLLEPWTREGISYALRSGEFAGEAAAKAAAAESPGSAVSALDEYAASVNRVLVPEMKAGRTLLNAFSKHPGMFHTGLATAKGQRLFGRICRSEITYAEVVAKPAARRVLAFLGR